MKWLIIAAAAGVVAVALVGRAQTPASTVGRALSMDGALDPVQVGKLKSERLRIAMLGIDYSSGRVRLTSDAEGIAKQGTPAEVKAQIEVADRWLNVENEHVEAIRQFTKAVILGPTDADALHGLGKALITKGKIDESVAAFRSALDANPSRVDTVIELAYNFQRLGHNADAIRAFEQALALAPGRGEAHARLAVLRYYEGDFATAWRNVHRAEALGSPAPPQLVELLRKQMAEPVRRP